MNDNREKQHGASMRKNDPAQKVKLVAELPGDDEMPEQNEEMKKNDGYEGSCGI